MMPMNDMDIGSFFTQDRLPIYDMIDKADAPTIFWQQCKRSWQEAVKLTGKETKGSKYRLPKHSMSPMLKSVFEEVHEKTGEEIYRSCTKFREPWNFTQYLFPDYMLLSGKAVEGEWSFRYFRLDDCQMLFRQLVEDKHSVICMNDNGAESFDQSRHDLIEVLDDIYPEKCRFEKEAV